MHEAEAALEAVGFFALHEAATAIKANCEHWLETGEAAGPERSKAMFDALVAALATGGGGNEAR